MGLRYRGYNRRVVSTAPTSPAHNYQYQNGPDAKTWYITPELTIRWDADAKVYACSGPWSDKMMRFKDALKLNIPKEDWDYDPDSKTWYIAERQFNPVCTLAKIYWKDNPGAVHIIDKQTVEAARARKLTRDGASGTDLLLLKFIRMLPNDALEKAYKTAVMMMHPDRIGTIGSQERADADEKFRSFQELWTSLKKDYIDTK
jgi:hypothetical protein